MSEAENKGGKLNLVPNEVKGYRIHPDQWNWKVVVIKEHGSESKKAGQEYETPLSYCKTIGYAISFIVNHVSAVEGEKAQKETFEKEGIISDLESLKVGFEKAEKAALDALADLESRLKEAGYNFKEISEGFRKNNVDANESEPSIDSN